MGPLVIPVSIQTCPFFSAGTLVDCLQALPGLQCLHWPFHHRLAFRVWCHFSREKHNKLRLNMCIFLTNNLTNRPSDQATKDSQAASRPPSQATNQASNQSTEQPSNQPSEQPTKHATNQASNQPTSQPLRPSLERCCQAEAGGRVLPHGAHAVRGARAVSAPPGEHKTVWGRVVRLHLVKRYAHFPEFLDLSHFPFWWYPKKLCDLFWAISRSEYFSFCVLCKGNQRDVAEGRASLRTPEKEKTGESPHFLN